MSLSLYDITIPVFIRNLRTLSTLLEKGRDHASTHSSEAALIEGRLFADMGNLSYQIQRVSDTCKGCAVRVAQATPEVFEDTETTFPELQERIKKTIAFLEKVDPKAMDGREEAEVEVAGRKLKGTDFVLGFAIPNFYFHMVTAYGILRKEGVPVGKKDYFGGM